MRHMKTAGVGQARSADQARDDSHDENRQGDGALVRCDTPLWREFLGAHRQLVDRLAEQMMIDHQLPLEWFDVLIHLAETPEMRLRQRTLRDRVLLSESGVSRLLVRMEQAGLITRTTADEDRRGVEVALTEKGRRTLSAATTSHLQLVDELFTDRLTTTDRVALHRVLMKLVVPL